MLRRIRHLDRAFVVHISGELRIGFASIHIGESGGEDDPIRPDLLDGPRYLPRVANINFFGTRPN